MDPMGYSCSKRLPLTSANDSSSHLDQCQAWSRCHLENDLKDSEG